MTIVNINQLSDLMHDELIVSRLKIKKKKSEQRSFSSFLLLKTCNIFALHLLAFSAVDSSFYFSALTVSVICAHFFHSYLIFDQRSASLSSYMRNFSSFIQHHKITLNLYDREIVVKRENRCKKCVERDVKCVKIKFFMSKNFKKYAFCIVFNEYCKYEV